VSKFQFDDFLSKKLGIANCGVNNKTASATQTQYWILHAVKSLFLEAKFSQS